MAKSNYYKNEISRNKNNNKGLWDVVKSLGTIKQQHEITEVYDNDVSITGNQQIAETFNNYYASVGKNLSQKIVTTPAKSKRTSSCNSFFLLPVHETEIRNIIKCLKLKKTPGIDQIKSETLKNLESEISPLLCHLIKCVFNTGIFPKQCKTTIVKPIYKKGDKNLITNYRPISLITTFAKIIEKAIKSRLEEYVNKYEIISKKQFGFRKGASTSDAIATLTEKLYTLVDKKQPTLCIFLDLAKAFDTVCHIRLLECLEDIGVRGKQLLLFKQYLQDREQIVKIQDSVSSKRKITFGVPQGTVLGPLLFLIYVNNLFNLKIEGDIVSYADDTAIMYSAHSWAQLKTNVEMDFVEIIKWFNNKTLTINFDKSHFMPFGSYRSSLPSYNILTFNIQGSRYVVKRVDTMSYLGVTIDSCLKWNKHITNITNTIRTLLYIIKQLKSIIDINHLQIVYYALIESRLQYAILTWGGALETHIRKLVVLQKRIIKIILHKKPTYPTKLLYAEAKIMTVYVFSIIMNLYKKRNTLETIQHTYQTRNKTNKYIPTSRTNKQIGQRCFSYLGSKIFNALPEIYKIYIRQINCTKYVKRLFKRFIGNLLPNEVNVLINT